MLNQENSNHSDMVNNQSDGPSQQTGLSLPNRRQFFNLLGGGAMCAAGFYVGRWNAQQKLPDKWDHLYGSLQKPRYRVDESLSYAPAVTFREAVTRIKSIEENPLGAEIPGCTEKLQLLNEELETLQYYWKAGTSGMTEDLKRAHREVSALVDHIHQIAIHQFRRVTDVLGNYHGQDAASDNASPHSIPAKTASDLKAAGEVFPNPEKMVRDLVLTLTQRPLPADVRFEKSTFEDPSVQGNADSFAQIVRAEDMDGLEMVLVFVHEVGHILAQHQEENVSGRCPRAPGEAAGWEEACAFALQFTATEYLAKKYSIDLTAAKVGYSAHLDHFYSPTPKKSEEGHPHPMGMAYYDAALTVLGSSAAAYNYLSSHVELTPEMIEVIESNRTSCDLQPIFGKLPKILDSFLRLVDPLTNEVQRAQKLSERTTQILAMGEQALGQLPRDTGSV